MSEMTDEQIKKSISIGGQMVEDITSDLEEIKKTLRDNQPVIDGIAANGGRKGLGEKKTLGNFLHEEITARKDEVESFLRNKSGKFFIDLKTAGILLASDHLTGDGMTSYNRPSISPGHLVNFRDLIPTTPSPTGTMTTYQEGTVTNSFANQTEGSAKAVQDYTWTEEKSDSAYLAATTTFSKQLMYKLSFLQNTLAKQLQRDFYKKENDLFFIATAQAATGAVSIPAGVTTDAEELLYVIANQIDASYAPSYAIVKPSQWARILATKPTEYSLPAGFSVDANGNVRVAGTILLPAAWAQNDHVLIFDRDWIERLETESMRIEFSFENGTNFEKNLVTARLECFEKLHVIRPDSVRYHDFGNS